MNEIPVARLRAAIARWYRRHGRDLPWRRTRDPYAILVSEVMLQQTQVDRVIPKYESFVKRFPTLRALARAPLRDVLSLWSGLGYNSRARRLWDLSRELVRRRPARLPSDQEELRSLPGIGKYTAAAVASFAFGSRAPVVDTNIRRVLSRAVRGVDDVGERHAWEIAQEVLPRDSAPAWNQALMDVGALFCRPAPRCSACPARNACRFAAGDRGSARIAAPRKTGDVAFAGSRRFYRGRIVKALTATASISFVALGEQVKDGFGKSDLPWLLALLSDLHGDGLVALDRRKRRARLP